MTNHKVVKKGRKELKWEICAPMLNARCLFASTCIEERFVYVYGGISGAMSGFVDNKRLKQSVYLPVLSDNQIE